MLGVGRRDRCCFLLTVLSVSDPCIVLVNKVNWGNKARLAAVDKRDWPSLIRRQLCFLHHWAVVATEVTYSRTSARMWSAFTSTCASRATAVTWASVVCLISWWKKENPVISNTDNRRERQQLMCVSRMRNTLELRPSMTCWVIRRTFFRKAEFQKVIWIVFFFFFLQPDTLQFCFESPHKKYWCWNF